MGGSKCHNNGRTLALRPHRSRHRSPCSIGRGIATINTSVMLGVACMQTFSGIIVGAFEPLADGARTETAYRTLFGVLTVVLIVAVAIYSRSQDVKPSDEMRACWQPRDA
jgi:hypothetical protein